MGSTLNHVPRTDIGRYSLEILRSIFEQSFDKQLVLRRGPVAGFARNIALATANLLRSGYAGGDGERSGWGELGPCTSDLLCGF